MILIKKLTDNLFIFGVLCIFLSFLCTNTIFPYIAITKAEKGQFKTACAYIVETKKGKNIDETIIEIEGKYYSDLDILPSQHRAFLIKRKEWLKFPLGTGYKDFLTVEPNKCKTVRYIEVYNIFGFRKIFLYDYIQ
ncbi:hypothetical protein [Alysiella filiformis]|uniref:Uncharacterized protein n=1 Tax=Alysiella filiformis DSM 16848 TaxID=1120981 RepID=A0A286ECY1_9NEIS|nr:hypothetical protein [Alysiella filiformis]QMT31911.1 hypothetical protein H3L97_03265 [Alysiella filiformis]UBQ57182.1 hypothetical protein JF568_05410 [Alysiella filiformis DSM 16848]SOD68746.1 hypothetical protein SAMN02746062_01384 [Alysiella filiformis DSM 16848]